MREATQPPSPDESPGLDAALRHAFGSSGGSAGDQSRSSESAARRLAKYRVLGKLGEGGMGEVEVAFDETLQRKVALKAIRSGQRLDVERRARFLREARILSQLDHPGICRIFDYVEDGDRDVLVLELVEGEDLAVRMRRRLARSQALDVALQLADALAAAHAAGIVHRDLKPANVMVTAANEVKVLDFGIARSDPLEEPETEVAEHGALGRSAGGTYRTQLGRVMGTLEYMSPEQARGEEVTAASDMYSFGLLLQEMLTGEPAHEPGLELHDLLRRARAAETRAAAGLPSDLARIVGRLTSPAPTRRPTAVEVAERLRWIRARPRRAARRAVAAAALLAVAGGALKYTLDLRAAYALADRRRAQAENAITVMLGDFWLKLSAVGRLEDLAEVAESAFDYFASVPEDELTDAELLRRSQLFYRIGEVRRARGNLPEATDAYERSLALAESLHERDPDDPEWLFGVGQARFYLGQSHWIGGDLEGARPWFQRYLETSERLAASWPSSVDYQVELAYARTNMAALEEQGGEHAAAVAILDGVVETWRSLAGREPGREEWRSELADALSWRAEALQGTGDLRSAVDLFREELAARLELERLDPSDRHRQHMQAICRSHLGDALVLTGAIEAGLGELSKARAIASDLCEHDPENTDWRRTSLLIEHATGRARRTSDPAAAKAHLADAHRTLRELRAADPQNGDWSRLLGVLVVERAELALDAGDLPVARELLSAFDPPGELAGDRPRSRNEPHLVQLALARLHAQTGEDDAARACNSRALELLDELVLDGDEPLLQHRRLRALLGLGRVGEAREVVGRLRAAGYADPTFVELVASARL